MPRHGGPQQLPSQPRLLCSNYNVNRIGLADNLDRNHVNLPAVFENRFFTWSGFPKLKLCRFAFSSWNDFVAYIDATTAERTLPSPNSCHRKFQPGRSRRAMNDTRIYMPGPTNKQKVDVSVCVCVCSL